VLDKLLTQLPEVARAISEPLTQVDKITIVSTGGDGKGAGANQITADIARMIAQVPELLETLTGVKLTDLLSHVSGLQSTAPASTNGTNGSGATPESTTSLQVIEGTSKPVDSPPKPADESES
jgi:flotillin